MIEITGIAKLGGPLTKRIRLADDGSIVSDGSACVMSEGRAIRLRFEGLKAFSELLPKLDPNEAITLGALRADLAEKVNVVTAYKLNELNGSASADLISRTADFIQYTVDREALALIDFDSKGMPDRVRAAVGTAGSAWNALVAVLPALGKTSRVMRYSTSSGISRSDTGQAFQGSGGFHAFLHVADGTDNERFLRTLHDRCWLAGLGWHVVGEGGQLLERSLVDRMVYAPERLVFEGAPVLDAPLVQDQAARAPKVFEGTILDTKEACPPLRIVEQAQIKELKAKSAHSLKPERVKAREKFVAKHTKKVAEKAGISERQASVIVARMTDGILLPDVVLPWDSEEFARCTVADILADPARFAGATMADPLAGVEYGRTKAMVMRRTDGSPWIHSFAHGRTDYKLRYDARAIRKAIEAAGEDEVVDTFIRMSTQADLPADELEALRNEVSKRANVNKRTLDTRLKQTKNDKAKEQAQEENDRRAAERLDSRPQIQAPAPDAPWLPQMQVLNDVLGSVDALEPPMRDIDGAITQVIVRRVPNMHALTADSVNDGETADTRLPPPEQPLLSRPDELQVAEIIERHIDYIDETGRSVHLAAPFVKHFRVRGDDILPTVAAIATLPIVMSDGSLLAKPGLDRARGIVFRIPAALLSILPDPKDCTDKAVVEAMQFLCDEFLADVAADYAGKCILIAAALTIIERALLDERPAFFVTAGRRGGGKTTTLIMLLMAITGVRPAAAAWSTGEEERRKSLLSHLMEAMPAIVWDNIVRGAQISCPHIEKACTSSFYADRRLGVTEIVSVAASSIHLFTGNNVGPKGDLASRSLQVRLEVDRPDPENRPFKHPDPIGWTESNRGRILKAFYTIMLGNPAIRPGSNVAPKTRFKKWWTLVGSAIEHAASLHAQHVLDRVAAMVEDMPIYPPKEIDFKSLFLQQEDDDEENAALSDALNALAMEYPKGESFNASDLTRCLNNQSEQVSDERRERIATLREFLYSEAPANQTLTAKGVGKRLKKHQGEPVKVGDKTLCLKAELDAKTNVTTFAVKPPK